MDLLKVLLMMTAVSLPVFAGGEDADSTEATTTESKTLRDKAGKHVLKIEIEAIYGAYQDASAGAASGFWLGGNSRLIVTNRHVASPDFVAKYYAVDTDGKRFELELIYSNPLVDLAYLKPKDEKVMQPSTTFEFSIAPDENKTVYMIGNNGGVGIGFQKAHITDISEIIQVRYPLKSFAISLNSKGGSSGSMVFNKEGKIIGVNYAVSDISAYAIPAEFVLEDLEFLNQGKIPPKKDIGIIFQNVRLNEAQNHYDFPKDFDVAAYNKTFKSAQSRLLAVGMVLPGTPSSGLFKPGDIITHVNEKAVGPDLFLFSSELNKQKDKVKITFVRQGKSQTIEVPLMDSNATQCTEMIVFGKAVFVPVDANQAFRTGLKVGSIGVFTNPGGSIFPRVNYDVSTTMLGILELDGQKVANLDDLERVIPSLIKKERFACEVAYCGPLHIDKRLATNREPRSEPVTYSPELHQAPVRFTYNWTTRSWEHKPIVEVKQG